MAGAALRRPAAAGAGCAQAVDAVTDHEASQLTVDLREHPAINPRPVQRLWPRHDHGARHRAHAPRHPRAGRRRLPGAAQDRFGASATSVSAAATVSRGTAPRAFGSGGDSPGSNPFGWGGHIDGLNSFFHAEPNKGAGQVENPDDTFMNFDCLVGIALNDQLSDNSGNLGLLPRSHWTNAA